MSKFIITTDRELSEAIQDFFNSVASHGRTLKLSNINHYEGYSDVIIENSTDLFIDPRDIFFMGYFARMNLELSKQKQELKPVNQ